MRTAGAIVCLLASLLAVGCGGESSEETAGDTAASRVAAETPIDLPDYRIALAEFNRNDPDRQWISGEDDSPRDEEYCGVRGLDVPMALDEFETWFDRSDSDFSIFMQYARVYDSTADVDAAHGALVQAVEDCTPWQNEAATGEWSSADFADGAPPRFIDGQVVGGLAFTLNPDDDELSEPGLPQPIASATYVVFKTEDSVQFHLYSGTGENGISKVGYREPLRISTAMVQAISRGESSAVNVNTTGVRKIAYGTFAKDGASAVKVNAFRQADSVEQPFAEAFRPPGKQKLFVLDAVARADGSEYSLANCHGSWFAVTSDGRSIPSATAVATDGLCEQLVPGIAKPFMLAFVTGPDAEVVSVQYRSTDAGDDDFGGEGDKLQWDVGP